MPRVVKIVADGVADGKAIVDTVILTPEQRRAPRGSVTGVNGTRLTFDLAAPVALRAGDFLQLDDGNLIEVVAEPEPLIEARAKDLTALARLAWHLGDRHVPVQLFANRLRVRRDPAIEALLARLGAKIAAIEAPFDPEGGAYMHTHAHGHGHHDHDHAHDHDHVHGHHHHRSHE
ncbi:MAG: urease accessory protein UreE [Hyphomicrobiales bacterium]|nr:urease accessory protein UreE [Hyphomicrobiales bacterium]MBV8826259.1 urease accessory protein UreE [Hyphomicrobiales bacterium]